LSAVTRRERETGRYNGREATTVTGSTEEPRGRLGCGGNLIKKVDKKKKKKERVSIRSGRLEKEE